MILIPQRPPGRASRKARAYEEDIRRLRGLGYSFEAIREALAAAGVHVSRSSVQREVERLARHPSRRPVENDPPPSSSSASFAEPATTSTITAGSKQSHLIDIAEIQTATTTEHRSGKEIAEAFMEGRISNPLILSRSKT